MPAKKAKKKRPFEKVMDFMELYRKLCETYNVEPLESVCVLYDDLISKAKAVKKLPQIFQFAEEEVTGVRLRPLIEAYQETECRVRFFSFLNTNSGDQGMHVLALCLAPPMEVAGIAYHNCGLGPSGCRALARAFVNSKSLAVLELDFNPGIGDEGVAGLCHYGHCPTMTKLSLKFCNIGDKGAVAIGKWLARDDCCLKELVLQGNQIGPAGVTELARHLQNNKSLTRLDLADNLFGFDGPAMSALAEGIKDCVTLNAVCLRNEFDCPEGIDQKFLDLATDKPLGECVLTPKMDGTIFQNIAAVCMANKKKIAKAAKKGRKKGGDDEEDEGESQAGGDSTSEEKPESQASQRPEE